MHDKIQSEKSALHYYITQWKESILVDIIDVMQIEIPLNNIYCDHHLWHLVGYVRFFCFCFFDEV